MAPLLDGATDSDEVVAAMQHRPRDNDHAMVPLL
jgi:hypothetical protein